MHDDACKSVRSRQEFSNTYLVATIGFDTAENEPSEVRQELYSEDRLSVHAPKPRPPTFSGVHGYQAPPMHSQMYPAAAPPQVTNPSGIAI